MTTEYTTADTFRHGKTVAGPSCHQIRIVLKDAADEMQPEFRHHWKEQFSLLYEGMPQETVLMLVDRCTADWHRDEVVYHYQPEKECEYNIIITTTEAQKLYAIERIVEGSVVPVLMPTYEEAMEERKNILKRLEDEGYKEPLFKMEFLRYRGYKNDRDRYFREIVKLLGLNYSEKNEFRLKLQKEYEELTDKAIADITGLDEPLVTIMRYIRWSPDQFCRYLSKFNPEQQERFIQAHIRKLEARKKMYTTSPVNDPIEHLPEIQRTFNEVDDIVEAQITRNGQGVCHAKWRLKKELLRKRGIDWMSPSEMNPRTSFE
jgi:hypothetical protein